MDLILDQAHIADLTLSKDIRLPDTPTLREAMAGDEQEQWLAAIRDKLDAIREAGTWTLVARTPGIQNIVGCRFVLQKKRGENGQVTKFKAQLVAQGFSQWEGVDFSETFAPVVKSALLHVFLTICAQKGWNVHQMDIKSAYLNAPITEDIYTSQPKGFEEVGRENLVAKLNKGLYGLKQAGREWYAMLRDFLISIGFRRTHADHSVFVFEWGSSIVIIPVYVNDELLARNDDRTLDSIQAQIGARFKASNLGTASWILGIRVRHNLTKGTLFIDQLQYIKTILECFNMTGCNTVLIPLEAKSYFMPATPEDHKLVKSFPYLEAIGSLMYAAMGTRPDISAAVRSLSPFASNFGAVHIAAVKHIFKYLARCPNQGILYSHDGSTLVGWTDADWANDRTNRKLISGHIFMLAGGAISWMSKQQVSVVTSSTHVEYVAATEAAKELVWLRRFLLELCQDIPNSTVLYIDNCAADLLAWNPVNHSVTKHIEVRYHYIRECIQDGSITLKLISTKDMAADVLTKSLDRLKHDCFCQMFGMEVME